MNKYIYLTHLLTNIMKCKHCGSENIKKAGIEYLSSGKKQRIRCKDCLKMSIVERE